MPVDPQAVIAIIRAVAAREVLPRFGRLRRADIRTKSGPADLVTVADIESERALTAALTAVLTGSRTLGEEAAEAEPTLLARLREDAPVWVLDPVDGTNNFARRRPEFAVIVALCRGDAILGGWIHRPLGGETVWAMAGEGAWIDGRRLPALDPPPIQDMRAALNRKMSRRLDAARPGRGGRLPKAVPRLFCAGCEYMALARGDLHVCQFDRLKPWDHAAGVLIHREVGGTDAYAPDGTPYRPSGPASGNLLLAPSPETWKILHGVVGAD